MANVKVTVSSNNAFYSKIMDSASVTGYVTTAKTTGYFESDDNDIFIPWENAVVVVNAEDFEQAGRDEVQNFGPTP